MSDDLPPNANPEAQLTPAARRALEEALARQEAEAKAALPDELAEELGGRKGPEPTRFGDWERKGIAVDF